MDRLREVSQTGLWLPEFAEPYEEFRNRDYKVTVASIRGGKAPIDQRHLANLTEGKWLEEQKLLEDTNPLHTISITDYDALFLPGGHGTMFDLPGDKGLEHVLSTMFEEGKVIAAVCHSPAGLVNMKLSNGNYLVKGKKLTAFTNDEERAANYDQYMPFLLESKLREQGAEFIGKPLWTNHVVVDGNLITGHNPQSSRSVASAVIEALG